jgi:CelD/BcsL family acetyltransferase involved in cellulose biosynthesis
MHVKPASSGLRARIVQGRALSASDVLAWRELLQVSAPSGNAFVSPTFVAAAAKAYGRVEACFIESSSGLAAVFPYQFPTAFAAAARAAVRVGEEMSDLFGVIAHPEFHCTPQEALAWGNLHYVYFTHLEETQLNFGLSGEKPEGGLRIRLPNGGAAYLDDLRRSDPKFSKDTERRLRKAAQELGQSHFCLEEPDPAAWLPRVLAEKRAQYLRTGKGDWMAPPGRTKLLEILSHVREPDCSPIVSTLAFGDTWAAIHFGLKAGRTLHYWFPVYNPALASYAPGRLLLHHIISNAAQGGIDVIDRGTGESQAKRDFPSERHTFYSGVWYRPGLHSLIYRAYQSLAWRLPKLGK